MGTDLVDGFDEKPSRGDAPDNCQYRGCDGYPETAVRFRDPSEYLVYCTDHGDKMFHEADAKYRTRLR